MTKQAPMDDPYRELIGLCRAGRLFEVDEWYKLGKPTQPPSPNRRLTPIGVAIDRGFHSLVEILLRHGVPPSGRPLLDAVTQRRADIVELLFHHGADVHSICFEDAVDSGSPQIIRMFIDRGADFVTNHPIAEGLKHITRPLLGVYKTYIEKYPELKIQANIALRHFCAEGSMRGVCLLLWLGADPRAKVPEHYDESDEFWNTSLREAVWGGHLPIVKKIGIDPARDDLNELLCAACLSQDVDTIRHLFQLGAKPDSEGDHGDSPIRNLIWRLQLAVNPNWPSSDWCRESRSIQCLEAFIELGGKWSPKDKREISSLRSCLYRMSACSVLDLVTFFKQHNFCSDEIIIHLLNTPKMRDHLRMQCRFKSFGKLIPFFKKWVAVENKAGT